MSKLLSGEYWKEAFRQLQAAAPWQRGIPTCPLISLNPPRKHTQAAANVSRIRLNISPAAFRVTLLPR